MGLGSFVTGFLVGGVLQKVHRLVRETVGTLRITFKLPPLGTHKPILLLIPNLWFSIHERPILIRSYLPLPKVEEPSKILNKLTGQFPPSIDPDFLALGIQAIMVA